jgi:hypothetical protein
LALSYRVDQRKEFADVRWLNWAASRDRYQHSARVPERDVARALVPVRDSVLFGHGYYILDAPVLRVIAHARQDLGRICHSDLWYHARYHRSPDGPNGLAFNRIIAALLSYPTVEAAAKRTRAGRRPLCSPALEMEANPEA